MALIPDSLSPKNLGDLLRQARENARITQAAAAALLDVARTTVVAMEQGQRRPRVDELQKLAVFYGLSLNELLRQDSVRVDLRPRFRQTGEQNDRLQAAVDLLNHLVQAEVELEDVLGIQRTRLDPPERPLLPGNVGSQAEQDAAELRLWLGLGLAPVHDIVSLLELQLGARVYIRKLDPKISGLYAFDERAGACILLNADHPRERRTQSGAHELGHFISTRHAPDTLHDGTLESTREERYANTFARCFLTPARAVHVKFQELTAGASKLTRRHIILLAHIFGVSREAMVRRLEELGLAKPGTWDWFVHQGGITDAQAREVLGDLILPDDAKIDARRQISMRMGVMASESWRQALLSEGQIARLLHIDRVDARALIDEFEAEGAETDGSRSFSA
ncbi:ImmA/IrrE family metallo-endopeptidase [Novosphingobium sp. Fuku2-ISO-50]|uniref:helix-turn-helix domain-containing protein n=1 Tax=Novosphingobium sp. Fuku2-ISO-50 TaxID=1739114 RepID=UPI00076C64FB|nr:XRE family transcriptional regulator [Novosphingobium sp. Fuku2-ISO-50]KUR75329.1 transcriptional regulator [Novosphingobium sp. Fuku2-ISO-50]